jgi:hypothetical protein
VARFALPLPSFVATLDFALQPPPAVISPISPFSRRDALKAMAAGAIGASIPAIAHVEDEAHSRLIAYLESLSRQDGGYGWAGQEQSHLTPTYFVIGCYHALKRTPPNKVPLAEFVRTHHPSVLKKLEQERRVFDFQQVQALVWLGEDVSIFAEKVRAWKQPVAYVKQYEKHGHPVFQSELGAISCRALIGLPFDDLRPSFVDYLNSRRRSNGSFNNTPHPEGGDGHLMNTWWGVQALHTLGRSDELKSKTITWVRSCQIPGGGFTWQPAPTFAGTDDIAYTWAAVRTLEVLGSEPADRTACLAWIQSLANEDGGFGDRLGWSSTPMATYYALEAFRALGRLDTLQVGASSSARARKPASRIPPDLRVFSIQLEAHGKGSPAEAVALARALHIHLWGAKNAEPAWLRKVQSLAEEQRVPVTFFVSNEEYGTWVDVPGLGTYSHTSDIVAPPGAEIGKSMKDDGVLSWPEFRQRRLAPLTKGAGRLIWQFGENEELVRLYLDDSIERGGYSAISTFHFGNPDFTNSEPFLHRWRGRIPFVALQDAHGNEPWWFADMTTGFRTLFMATEPTWESWLRALENNWVAAVRHDAWSGFKTWMHTGSSAVAEFIHERETEWRWWNIPEIQRPLVSLVALKPDDLFEAARPEKGVSIRVRCAWNNTPQGLAKSPISELLRLRINGNEVAAQRVEKRQGGNFADIYHLFHIPDPAPGRHTVSALIRVIDSNAESEHSIEFDA